MLSIPASPGIQDAFEVVHVVMGTCVLVADKSLDLAGCTIGLVRLRMSLGNDSFNDWVFRLWVSPCVDCRSGSSANFSAIVHSLQDLLKS